MTKGSTTVTPSPTTDPPEVNAEEWVCGVPKLVLVVRDIDGQEYRIPLAAEGETIEIMRRCDEYFTVTVNPRYAEQVRRSIPLCVDRSPTGANLR